MRSAPPLRLVDSHAHLDMEDFDSDRESVVERSFEGGLEGILCPADLTDARGLEITLGMASRHPGVFAAAGIHPHHAAHFRASHMDVLRRLAAEKVICAVGEVGVDFHYNLSPPQAQREAFRAQAILAGELGLPLIVHTRQAGQEAADILEQSKSSNRGVFHCYTEDWPLAERLLGMGFWISFSGILTFPRADSLREVASRIPKDRVLVETDSPYLVPAPHRGKVKRNEPRFVVEVARVLAEVQGLAPEEMAKITVGNFRALFQAEPRPVPSLPSPRV